MKIADKIEIPETAHSKARLVFPRTAVFTELPDGTMYCKYTGRGMSVKTFYEVYCSAAALDGITVRIKSK